MRNDAYSGFIHRHHPWVDRARPCFSDGKSWEREAGQGEREKYWTGRQRCWAQYPWQRVRPCSNLDLIPFWYKKGQDQEVSVCSSTPRALLHMPPHQPRRQEADGGTRFRVARQQQPSRLALHCGSLPRARCLGFTEIVPQPQGTCVKPCMHVTHFVPVTIPIWHLLLCSSWV